MDGKALAERVRAEVAQDVAGLLRPVGLATVLVGEDPASEIYIKRKQEACREVGIEPFDHKLSAETTEEELLRLVAELNADERVTGILCQLPLLPRLVSQVAGGISGNFTQVYLHGIADRNVSSLVFDLLEDRGVLENCVVGLLQLIV